MQKENVRVPGVAIEFVRMQVHEAAISGLLTTRLSSDIAQLDESEKC